MLLLIAGLGLALRTSAAVGDSPCTAKIVEACTAIGSITYTMSSTGNWTAAGNGITDPTSTCLGTGNKDVNYWFAFTATADDQSIIFNFLKPSGSSAIADCGIQVYSASSCSSPFTFITCQNNSADNHANTSAITLTAGTTYYVRLFEASGNGSGNSFSASVTLTKNTSIGQTACNARVIGSLPFTYSSNTLCNTNTIAGNCAGKTAGLSGSGEDYWFKYTSAGNEYISITLSGLNSSISQGLVISNPAATCSSAITCYTSTAANGSFPGGIAGVPSTSSSLCRTVYLSSPGNYYLIVDAAASRGGPFTLSVSGYAASNTSDACAWAQGITYTAATYTIDNCSFTKDHAPAEINSPIPAASGASGCGFTSENSMWFTFVADDPAPPEIAVSVAGISCSSPDNGYTAGIEIGIFTGSCGGSWTKVGSCLSTASGNLSQTISSPPAGQQYYLVADGVGGSICSFSVSATNVVALPVNLVQFDARFNGEDVDLEWHTASEMNNRHFTVERSYDGVSFEPVMTVNAAGNGSHGNYYSAIDSTMSEGLVYYLLRQTDNDGRSTLSPVRTVIVTRPAAPGDITVFPNPATSWTEVMFPEGDGEGVMYVTDVLGKWVEKRTVRAGEEKIMLNIGDNAKGIYWITLERGGKVLRTKLVRTQ